MASLMLMVACVALLASLSIEEAPQPRGRGETLEAAGAAAAAVLARAWQPHCCVIMLTDGAASTHAVAKALRQMAAPWGAAVLEVPPGADGPKDSLPLLRRALRQAHEVQRVSWCVVVVVVSDDPSFLAAWTELARSGGLLAWPTQLVALTGLPKDRLRHLHSSFSHVNAVLIVSDGDDSPRCEVVVHFPYSEHVVQVARWRSGRLTLASSLPLFPDKFHRFVERPFLRLTAQEFPPHVVMQYRAAPGGGTKLVFSGAMMSVLEVLAQSLNFSYDVVPPPDGSFGNRLPNGTVTGMVGMVVRQEVDLGLGPFGFSAVRTLIIDYTVPVVNDYLRILAGRGRPEVDPWGFLLPLAPLVWVGLVVALVVVMAIVLLLARCVSLYPPALAPYVRVLLQENSWLPALWGWERLVLGGWMLAMLVVTQSYTGNLMSLLAVRYIPQPFQTLRALLDDSATTMIWEYNTAYVNYFRTTETGILREVRKMDAAGQVQYVLATEYSNMLRGEVRRGSHVFIGEDLTSKILMAQQFSETGSCDFYTSRESFMPFLYCMIGPKHSPLVQSVSKRITWITEAGLYDHWMGGFSSNSTVCERPPTKITVRTPLSLGNVWGMFAILVVGNAVSLLLFLVEVLAGHHLHFLLTATSSWT
ncbi:probable glutamate receptor [Scylla paramamosain]|uniref:probable glutamate receptor n=1 Tax=Scylla paramamosain TaxID=85552 RepID=UPI003083B898